MGKEVNKQEILGDEMSAFTNKLDELQARYEAKLEEIARITQLNVNYSFIDRRRAGDILKEVLEDCINRYDDFDYAPYIMQQFLAGLRKLNNDFKYDKQITQMDVLSMEQNKSETPGVHDQEV